MSDTEKRALRARAKALRAERAGGQTGEALADALVSSPFCKAPSLFVYLSAGTEADTHALILRLLAAGRRVCVPRVQGREMSAVAYPCELERGSFGILQPARGADEPCAVALVPLLLAVGGGTRLGYGGGYCDRYLASRPETVRVGLCHAFQVTETPLPAEAHDVRMDFLLTERGVRICAAADPARAKICANYFENLTD